MSENIVDLNAARLKQASETRPPDTTGEAGEPPRWIADVVYLGKAEKRVFTHLVDEIEQLHELVESGPNFYCIDHIVIRLNPASLPGYRPTLEEAFNT